MPNMLLAVEYKDWLAKQAEGVRASLNFMLADLLHPRTPQSDCADPIESDTDFVPVTFDDEFKPFEETV